MRDPHRWTPYCEWRGTTMVLRISTPGPSPAPAVACVRVPLGMRLHGPAHSVDLIDSFINLKCSYIAPFEFVTLCAPIDAWLIRVTDTHAALLERLFAEAAHAPVPEHAS
eukprot:6181919-Pleurochrysis_carterae.AAC.2